MLKADKIISFEVPEFFAEAYFPNDIEQGWEKQVTYQETNVCGIKIIKKEDADYHAEAE